MRYEIVFFPLVFGIKSFEKKPESTISQMKLYYSPEEKKLSMKLVSKTAINENNKFSVIFINGSDENLNINNIDKKDLVEEICKTENSNEKAYYSFLNPFISIFRGKNTDVRKSEKVSNNISKDQKANPNIISNYNVLDVKQQPIESVRDSVKKDSLKQDFSLLHKKDKKIYATAIPTIEKNEKNKNLQLVCNIPDEVRNSLKKQNEKTYVILYSKNKGRDSEIFINGFGVLESNEIREKVIKNPNNDKKDTEDNDDDEDDDDKKYDEEDDIKKKKSLTEKIFLVVGVLVLIIFILVIGKVLFLS